MIGLPPQALRTALMSSTSVVALMMAMPDPEPALELTEAEIHGRVMAEVINSSIDR